MTKLQIELKVSESEDTYLKLIWQELYALAKPWTKLMMQYVTKHIIRTYASSKVCAEDQAKEL